MDDHEVASRIYPVREDMAQQRRAWRFERIGWAGLLLLIALTFAGLFSKGPLSQVSAHTADGALQVQYERFSRNGAQDDMVVTATGSPGQMRYLQLGGELLKGVSIEALHPEPAPLRSEGQDLVIPMQADSRGVATLYLTLRNNGVGLYRARLALIGGESLAIPKLIYP